MNDLLGIVPRAMNPYLAHRHIFQYDFETRRVICVGMSVNKVVYVVGAIVQSDVVD